MAYQNQNNARQNNRQGGQGERTYKKESDYDKRGVVATLDAIREQYARMLARHGLNIEEEIAFIWSIFTTNLSILEKACQEPEQFKRALLNQASVGLSLDPGRQLSYLVVRKYKLIWDIGYRGLLRIAMDEGMITHAIPELVHTNDDFEFKGPSVVPVHTVKGTGFFLDQDRGPIIGAYVIAALPGGGVAVETMKETEFQEIALLNPESDAWKKDFSKGEMRRKTLIKRAFKWWPRPKAVGKTSDRLQAAVTYLNEEAGEGIPSGSAAPTEPEAPTLPPDDQVSDAVKSRALKVIGRGVAQRAYKPCAGYLSEIFSGQDLAWALDQLKQAEAEAEAAKNSDPEPPLTEPDPE